MKAQRAENLKFSYEDYLHLPEDKRYEIIEGELFMAPSPITAHQDILRNLGFFLWMFIKEKDLGKVYYAPFDVIFSETDIVQPDILFISKERLGIITEENVQGAPDLIVEILSPSNPYRDKVIKKKLYSKYGVKEYWIVDPKEEKIEVFILERKFLKSFKVYSKEDTLESCLLRELRIDVKQVFI